MKKNNLFGDIINVVAGTFQFTENAHQIHTRMYCFRMFNDIIGKDSRCLCVDFVQQIIFAEYGSCHFNTLLMQGTFLPVPTLKVPQHASHPNADASLTQRQAPVLCNVSRNGQSLPQKSPKRSRFVLIFSIANTKRRSIATGLYSAIISSTSLSIF